MRVLIAYYSHTNNTEKLAFNIKREFEINGHSVDMERILASRERSVWGWFFWRILASDTEIISPKICDVAPYDLICIGSPNWTKISLPVSRYLKMINNLAYKKVGLFSTTALSPVLEWYVFSAYSLENTFSATVERRKGRPIATLLLSSMIASRGIDSSYGKRLIGDFCQQMISPFTSYKNYILLQKDLKEARFLAMICLTGLPLVIIAVIGLMIIRESIIYDWRFWTMIFSYMILCNYLIMVIRIKKRLNSSRYITTSISVIWWTIIISLFPTTIGDFVIYGYLLIVTASILFQDSLLFFVLGGIIAINLIFIVALFPPVSPLFFWANVAFLYAYLFISSIISQRMRCQLVAYSETQDDIETARDSLDIRVRARTRELTELTLELDKKVKERTIELEEKLEILEKFNRLTVGRELKIIALKEELMKLRDELENINK